MDNFNDYLKHNNEILSSLSSIAYDGHVGSSSVVFSFDYKPIITDVCFARMYSQIKEAKYKREFSSNYIMRMPYLKEDKDETLHANYVDYPTFFKNLQELMEDTYKITVYDTDYRNIKFVSMESKIELPLDLNYCLTLVLYTMIRGIEGENNYSLRKRFSKTILLSGDIKEYLYTTSKENRGSHHNVSDSLDKIANHNNLPEEFKEKIFENYVKTLKITFGKDGLIHNPEYIKYFEGFFDKKPNGYGNAMQTKSFDYINLTTNRIIRESLQ